MLIPKPSPAPAFQSGHPVPIGAAELCRVWRRATGPGLFLPRYAAQEVGFRAAGLVAHRPTLLMREPLADPRAAGEALRRLSRLLRDRRRPGGTSHTGVAFLLAYDPWCPTRAEGATQPGVIALAVDRSVCFEEEGVARLTSSVGDHDLDRLRADVDAAVLAAGGRPPDPARAVAPPRTSLPRLAYLRAVETVRRRIALGDIYQANLCQRFRVPVAGDPFEWWVELARRSGAPCAAWFEAQGLALASISPETFLSVDPDGRISTRPIKGTRPRGADPRLDRQAARELMASVKDRAELLMIVDLERNDLGRVCRIGSVTTTSLAELHSFPTVHHLVARVEGQLRDDVELDELIAATFPGGSISGAPKLAAMRILGDLEPAQRGFFTGCLFWAGDDGSLDSSILIRSVEFQDGHAWLGAGGGVVADSDPEQEWHEANHKARAPARALGFEPEDAS